MNAVNVALSRIRFAIPEEVLLIGFIENSKRVNAVTSLDERIMNSVIRPRVLIDLNLTGGVEVRIPVGECNYTIPFPGEIIITVPKELTMGRSIVSVQNLLCNVGYATGPTPYYTTSLVSAANNMYTNLANVPVVQTSRLELIGENTVLVQDPSIAIFNAILRCTVENEENLANLHPMYYQEFANLCILAVKSYIYNYCRIKLDQGYIYGGIELGAVTDEINSYSEAEEQYKEFLKTVMKKILAMNQTDISTRLIRAALGNTI